MDSTKLKEFISNLVETRFKGIEHEISLHKDLFKNISESLDGVCQSAGVKITKISKIPTKSK